MSRMPSAPDRLKAITRLLEVDGAALELGELVMTADATDVGPCGSIDPQRATWLAESCVRLMRIADGRSVAVPDCRSGFSELKDHRVAEDFGLLVLRVADEGPRSRWLADLVDACKRILGPQDDTEDDDFDFETACRVADEIAVYCLAHTSLAA